MCRAASTMHTGCCTPWKMRDDTSGWWPSGVQSITQISWQRWRKSCRMRSNAGPLMKPAAEMKATMPWPPPSAWPSNGSNTLRLAQRQK